MTKHRHLRPSIKAALYKIEPISIFIAGVLFACLVYIVELKLFDLFID